MKQAQSAAQVARQQLRWVPGYQVSVSQWVMMCRGSQDARFEALSWGLEFGVRTGRLPGWVRDEDWVQYLAPQGARLSSVQGRALLARAAGRLDGDYSQAAALRALQAECGVVVR